MITFKLFLEKVTKPTGDLKKACWTGYTAVGTKQKNGRTVPNCVPEEVELDEMDDYPHWDSKEGKALKKAYKKVGKKYGPVDLKAPSRLKPAEKTIDDIHKRLNKEEVELFNEFCTFSVNKLDEPLEPLAITIAFKPLRTLVASLIWP